MRKKYGKITAFSENLPQQMSVPLFSPPDEDEAEDENLPFFLVRWKKQEEGAAKRTVSDREKGRKQEVFHLSTACGKLKCGKMTLDFWRFEKFFHIFSTKFSTSAGRFPVVFTAIFWPVPRRKHSLFLVHQKSRTAFSFYIIS